MTKNELSEAWKASIEKSGTTLRIKHKNHKTVFFYPTSYEESVFFKFWGFWISTQINEPIAQEMIKIKKEDLENWDIL